MTAALDRFSKRRAAGAAAPRFRLVRYFTLTSLAMFVLVAGVLAYFARMQGDFFNGVQYTQSAFFNRVQTDFANERDRAARRDLLLINEAANVNLTRLFANALWLRDIAPHVELASKLPIEHCQAIADAVDPKDGKSRPGAEKKACFAELGRRIAALPGYEAVNAKVFEAMKGSTAVKIKVFDLRGITVYSSERAQVGEDKSSNAGWRSAAIDGVVKSELSFRDKFSAFEGVIEKRDMISSYLPVTLADGPRIVGVFEVYSDVTPFLAHVKATSAQIAKAAEANRAQVESMAHNNQAMIDEIGRTTLVIVLGLLLLLFVALFAIVRRADRLLAEQARERERAQQQLTQSEKMASLGQMVAGIAHQLNTPIAFSHNNVSMAIDAIKGFELPLSVAGRFSHLVKSANSDRLRLKMGRNTRAKVDQVAEADLDVATPMEMLADTLQGLDQMRELVQNLRDFTRLDRSKVARADLNRCLRNVAYIARSVLPSKIRFVEHYGELPEIECNPSQLNQVFLNLINNAAQAIDGEHGVVTITSRVGGDRLRVDIEDTGCGIPPEVLPHIWDTYYTTKKAGEGTGLGLAIAREIVQEHGGSITVQTQVGRGSTFSVLLPTPAAEPQAETAAAAEPVAA